MNTKTCNCALPAITGSFDCCKGCNPESTGRRVNESPPIQIENDYMSKYYIVTDRQLAEMIDERIKQALKERAANA